jgi:hypothetical protein
MRFLLSSSPQNLQAACPDVTVEAEYGDVVVMGRLLTMAHHGPRAGQPAPCSYPNNCAPGAETVGLSHVDLDTVAGCLAALGRKPEAPSFWALAEFVDLNGAHKLAQAGASKDDLRRLHAYWAFSQKSRVFAPRDGSVADVTDAIRDHLEAVETLLGPETTYQAALLAAGDKFAADESALDLVSFRKVSPCGSVMLRVSGPFVNHLYAIPGDRGKTVKAIVTHNPSTEGLSGGAITLSLADPIPGVSCGEILKGLFGPEAGGHAGIGGSPRGKPLPLSEAERVFDEVVRQIGGAA